MKAIIKDDYVGYFELENGLGYVYLEFAREDGTAIDLKEAEDDFDVDVESALEQLQANVGVFNEIPETMDAIMVPTTDMSEMYLTVVGRVWGCDTVNDDKPQVIITLLLED